MIFPVDIRTGSFLNERLPATEAFFGLILCACIAPV